MRTLVLATYAGLLIALVATAGTAVATDNDVECGRPSTQRTVGPATVSVWRYGSVGGCDGAEVQLGDNIQCGGLYENNDFAGVYIQGLNENCEVGAQVEGLFS